MLILTIKQGKEKSLLDKQPWIYLSAVERVDGKPAERFGTGTTCVVRSSKAEFLARAAWNPHSQIRARVWSFDESEAIDHAMFKRRIQAALAKRAPAKPSNGKSKTRRLINAEADNLPGLIVDYVDLAPGYLLCEFQAAGVDAWKVPIVKALIAATNCPNVFEIADELVRKGEGLPVNYGVLAGDEPPPSVL